MSRDRKAGVVTVKLNAHLIDQIKVICMASRDEHSRLQTIPSFIEEHLTPIVRQRIDAATSRIGRNE